MRSQSPCQENLTGSFPELQGLRRRLPHSSFG